MVNWYANYRVEIDNTARPASRAQLFTWFERQGDAALRWLGDQCLTTDLPATIEVAVDKVSAARAQRS